MSNETSDSANSTPSGDLISLAEAARTSGLSHSHLRLLVRQGKVWGTKIGRDWLTTEEAIRAYLATERKPGPKPRDDDQSDITTD
jgi:hypothetical protein